MNGSGCCAISEFGKNKTVSFGVCLSFCDHYTGPARGRGDLLAKLIKTVTAGTVTPCNGCHDRIHDMNAKHPSKQTRELLAGVSR